MSQDDIQEFYDPDHFGFPVPSGYILMRLFPLYEMQVAAEHDYLEKYLEISNFSQIFGPNITSMNGTIINTSIGSPIFGYQSEKFKSNPDDSTFFKGSSLRKWITKYVGGQCFNVASTLIFYPNSGFNIYIDITENTVLSANMAIHDVIELLKTTTQLYSIIESESSKKIVNDLFMSMLYGFKSITTDKDSMPLWKIMITIIYGLFRAYNRRIHKEKITVDFPLRIFLLKRRGLFVCKEHEEIPGGVPIDHMSQKVNWNFYFSYYMWLGLAQYWRIMTLIQKPFSIKLFNGDSMQFRTIPFFVFRDAHHSSSSSLSNEFDQQFLKFSMENKKNVIMLGVHGEYKLIRHAHTGLGSSWVNISKPSTRFGEDTFGIWAGVCWFYNHDPLAPLLDDTVYPIIRLPFEKLVERFTSTFITNAMHYLVPTWAPSSMNSTDALYIGKWSPMDHRLSTIFSYGLDEYILSRFAIDHLLIKKGQNHWNDFNLLFYTITFMINVLKNNDNDIEYLPIYRFVCMYELLMTQKKLNLPDDITVGNVLLELYKDPTKRYIFQITFETLFGNQNGNNVSNLKMNELSLINIDITCKKLQLFFKKFVSESYNTIYDKIYERNMLESPWVGNEKINPNYKNAVANYVRQKTIYDLCMYVLHQVHRYDRPFYWRSGIQKKISLKQTAQSFFVKIPQPKYYGPRYRNNNIPFIPSNLQSYDVLEYVIKNPIEFDCASGVCDTNQNANAKFVNITPLPARNSSKNISEQFSITGGTHTKKRKSSKTTTKKKQYRYTRRHQYKKVCV